MVTPPSHRESRPTSSDLRAPGLVLMEQWTGSKSGKEHIKAVYCHPAYLTYTQSTS